MNAEAAKSASEKLIIWRHCCERKTLAVLSEQTTADERKGVEKFATVGGLAEWKRTFALTRGRSNLFEKFEISWRIVILVVVRSRCLLV